MLTEGVVLASAGGVGGLLLAGWATRALTAMVAAGTATTSSIDLATGTNARVLGFNTAVALVSALIFGLAPAFRGVQGNARGNMVGRRFTLGKALVVSQVALTVVLLLGAGLLIRTLRNLQTQNLGFSRDHLLLIWMSPMQTGRTGETLAPLVETVRSRVAGLPGVRSASISNGGMLEGGTNYGAPSEYTLVEGQPPKPGLGLRLFAIAPQFFATAGMPLLAGRDLDERDTETSPKVAVVNETMARFYFGSGSLIGKHFGGPRGTETASIASLVQEELRRIDAAIPVHRINTVAEQVDDALAQERMIAALCGFFGIVAVVLAAVGLYGVLAYTVTRRTKEIGIRMAIGSQPSALIGMMLWESLSLVAAGIGIGLPAGIVAARLIESQLFGVTAADALTAVATAGLMIAVALLAGWIPARRAARIDPMTALRCD
jgi:hypothetical protein